jgi:hypothetical protein
VDKNKTLTFDYIEKSIEINNNQKVSKILMSDIQNIIMTTGFKRSSSFMWSGYYFYQMELIDGEIIYLTSLLLKKKDLPFKVDLKRHIGFPFVKYFDLESERLKEVKSSEKEAESQINRYYKQYSDYSYNDLKMIVDYKEKFQTAAVRAAERLIKRIPRSLLRGILLIKNHFSSNINSFKF